MIDSNKVLLMDCIEMAKKIPNESMDIIIADPPYYNAVSEEWDRQWSTIFEWKNWCNSWLEECKRILKPTGTMFIYGYEQNLAYISTLLDIDKQRWLVWYYTNKTVPSLNSWQHSHESIISYTSSKESIFNKDLVREPYTDKFVKNFSGKIRPSSSSARFGNKETIYNVNEKGALPRDVIQVPALAGGSGMSERIIYCETCGTIIDSKERKKHENHKLLFHPTQKPKELTKRLINSCKPEGRFKVFVPFAGSGSECIVIRELEGDFFACDTNSNYCKLANELLKYKK